MKVYAHYIKDAETKIEYRWRTLLQFGTSWNIIGSVYMKNPGQAYPLKEVSDIETLSALQSFDDEDKNCTWYLFKEDRTMCCIRDLFQEYTIENRLPFSGVVQIFNLFNVRDADRNSAIEKRNRGSNDKSETIAVDINYLVAPVYLGWGNLGKSPEYIEKAKLIFGKIMQQPYNQHYLLEDFHHNSFCHPLCLMQYRKNTYVSKWLRICFFQNTSCPQGVVYGEREKSELQIIKDLVKTIELHYKKENIAPFDIVWTYQKYTVVIGKQYPYAIDITVDRDTVEITIQNRKNNIEVLPQLEVSGFTINNKCWHKARYLRIIHPIDLDEIFRNVNNVINVIKELEI